MMEFERESPRRWNPVVSMIALFLLLSFSISADMYLLKTYKLTLEALQGGPASPSIEEYVAAKPEPWSSVSEPASISTAVSNASEPASTSPHPKNSSSDPTEVPNASVTASISPHPETISSNLTAVPKASDTASISSPFQKSSSSDPTVGRASNVRAGAHNTIKQNEELNEELRKREHRDNG